MCFRKVGHLWIILKNLLLRFVVILIILNSRTIAPWLNSRWRWSSTCRWLDSFGSPSRRLRRHKIIVLGRWKSMAVFDALRLSVRLIHILVTSVAVRNARFLLTFLRTRRSRKSAWSNHLVLLVAHSASSSWYVRIRCTFGSDSQNRSILIHFWTFALENVVILLLL